MPEGDEDPEPDWLFLTVGGGIVLTCIITMLWAYFYG